MPKVFNKIRRSLARDRELPLSARISKGARYIAASASAPFFLRDCDEVGPRARTIGKPSVDNLGAIEIGADFICNSMFAPVELVRNPGGRIEIGDRRRSITARRFMRRACAFRGPGQHWTELDPVGC